MREYASPCMSIIHANFIGMTKICDSSRSDPFSNRSICGDWHAMDGKEKSMHDILVQAEWSTDPCFAVSTVVHGLSTRYPGSSYQAMVPRNRKRWGLGQADIAWPKSPQSPGAPPAFTPFSLFPTLPSPSYKPCPVSLNQEPITHASLLSSCLDFSLLHRFVICSPFPSILCLSHIILVLWVRNPVKTVDASISSRIAATTLDAANNRTPAAHCMGLKSVKHCSPEVVYNAVIPLFISFCNYNDPRSHTHISDARLQLSNCKKIL